MLSTSHSLSAAQSSPSRAYSALNDQDLAIGLLSQIAISFPIFNARNKVSLYRQCTNSANIVDSKFSNDISILLELAVH